jgi:hypothetical protein
MESALSLNEELRKTNIIILLLVEIIITLSIGTENLILNINRFLIKNILPVFYFNNLHNSFHLHLEIDNGGRLKTKLYDKRDDFTFPVFQHKPSYTVYISQLIRYSRAFVQYNDLLDRTRMLTFPRSNGAQRFNTQHNLKSNDLHAVFPLISLTETLYGVK